MISRILAVIVAAIMSVASASTVSPATPTDQYAVYEDGVVVCVELDTPLDEIQYGNTIMLRCIVYGINKPYTIQWQHSIDLETWDDIQCNDDVYEFVMDETTAGTYYRVVIIRSDSRESSEQTCNEKAA